MISQTLSKAWKVFTANKKYLALIVIIELLFLMAFAGLQYYFFYPSAEAAARAGDAISKEMEKLPETEAYQLEGLLANNPHFMQAYKDLLTSMIYFLLGTLVAWIIFKGLVWHLTHKSVKKITLKQTWWKFALLSVFWFIATAVVFLLYSLATGSTDTLLPMESSTATDVFLTIIFLIIFYFAQISFALIPEQQTFKKTFVCGWKHAKTIIPAFLVNLLITFVFIGLPFTWAGFAPKIGIQYGTALFAATIFITIILGILALAYTRLHMVVIIWQKHS